MFAATDVLLMLHFALLLGLLGVTSLLLLIAVTNRLRLRSVVLSWPSGRFFGLPAAPSVFILILLSGIIYLAAMDRFMSTTLLAGYLTGGTFWLAASFIAQTVLVTEYGLVLDVNHTDRTIAWGQVVDYFQYGAGYRQGYVFFYTDDAGVRRRLQLSVPSRNQKAFEALIAAKLDARFEFAAQKAYGKTAMEG